MSSTGRGAVRSPGDYYRTPAWCVDAIRPHLGLGEIDLVFDAGCGTGAIGQALAEGGGCPQISGIELDMGRHVAAVTCGAYQGVARGSYLEIERLNVGEARVLHIANPPYSLALEFVRKAIALAGDRGRVAMLLRLGFLGSRKRRDFHAKHPADVYVLSKRPSFCSSFRCSCGARWSLPAGVRLSPCPNVLEGGVHDIRVATSDSCEYAWFVWGGESPGKIGVL